MLLNVNYELLLLRTFSKIRQSFAIHLNRCYSSDNKHESYFSAIGGQTDKPPPDLTPQQVSNSY
jgi:hypothetical protein